METNDDLLAKDLPKGVALLSELKTNADSLTDMCEKLIEEVREENFSTDHGISLLELKNQLFLSYLSNLSYTTLLKLSGEKLEGNSAIDRLVQSRVILERIRPLEDKLKHHIQKYVQISSSDSIENKSDELSKNRLENIENSDSENEEKKKPDKKEQKLYRIPKIGQQHYPGDEEKERENLNNNKTREKFRALSSAMLRDALEEHTDDPEVVHENSKFKQKAREKLKQIERYEEENFTRLNLTKKERANLKQISTPGNITKDILSFRTLDSWDTPGSSGGKKRKKNSSSSKKKGKGFKKRKKK